MALELSMRRHAGLTKFEWVIAASLATVVAGLGVAVQGALASRERMSNARRDVGELNTVLGAQTPIVAADASLETAPPKTSKRRARRAPATSPAASASRVGPSSPLSALPRAGDDDDFVLPPTMGDESNDPDESAPWIDMLAPFDDLMDDEPEDDRADDDKPAPPAEPLLAPQAPAPAPGSPEQLDRP